MKSWMGEVEFFERKKYSTKTKRVGEMIPSGCKLKISAFSAVVVDETVEAVTFPPLKVEGGESVQMGPMGIRKAKLHHPLTQQH